MVQHGVGPVQEQGRVVFGGCPECTEHPGLSQPDQRQLASWVTISWLRFSLEGLFPGRAPPAWPLFEVLSGAVGGQQGGHSWASGWLEPPSLLFHGDFRRAEGLPGLFFPAQTLLVTQLWAHPGAAPVLLLIKDSLQMSCGSQRSSSSNYFSKPFFLISLPFGGF